MVNRHNSRLVQAAQRELLLPLIEQSGFAGKRPTWIRETQSEIHFIKIEAAKYGGGFFISGAWGSKKKFGDTPPSLAATDFNNRACVTRLIDLWNLDGSLHPHRSKEFEYQYMSECPAACRALVSEAMPGVKALIGWFATKTMPDELAPVFDRIDSAPNPDLGRKIALARVRQGLD